jgi:Tfp pilus assembly protein PilF
MRYAMILATLCWIIGGCAGSMRAPTTVLQAPAGTAPAVTAQLDRGNTLFGAGDWAGAEKAFRETIAAQPTFAEAHYNLAVALERSGNKAEAKKHYLEAANLAPGHKIIWDSPPFRETGLTHNIDKKHPYMDIDPKFK